MSTALREPHPPSQRLAWVEGIRIVAAVAILLYHAQLLITNYAYTPQPTGLRSNLAGLVAASDRIEGNWLLHLFSFPIWFGFQFVDIFVLVSGFSLVMSLKGKPLELKSFFKRRLLRILWPFWTIAWFSYPILWVFGKLTNSYSPDAWHMFAGVTFPLLFDFGGRLLLPTNGPWWFVALIICLTLIFPLLWLLLQRWGAQNLLGVSLVLTVAYRLMAVYWFGGHPTYVIWETSADWLPFVPFFAKLSIFVLGMVIADAYQWGRGPLFWSPAQALLVGVPLYGLGFVGQFYRFGWVVCDLLVAAGLMLCCQVVFQFLANQLSLASSFRKLGAYSYSYFLIHNFVVDRTLNLFVKTDGQLYEMALPVMIVGTLVLAILANYLTPYIEQGVLMVLRQVDRSLSSRAVARARARARLTTSSQRG